MISNETPDPDAKRDQELFAPADADFWNLVQPPPVSESVWAEVEDAIARRCLVPMTVPIRRWIAVGLGAMIAATVVAVVYAWRATDDEPRVVATQTRSVQTEVAPDSRSSGIEDPLADYAILPVARPGDALIESVRGGISPFVVGPSQPVPDELTLAGPFDIRVEAIRPAGATGTMPDSKVTTEPGGVPMIYAALPR